MLRTIILLFTLLVISLKVNSMDKFVEIKISCINHNDEISECQQKGCLNYLIYTVNTQQDGGFNKCEKLSALINSDSAVRNWLYKQTFPGSTIINLTLDQWYAMTTTWDIKKRKLYDKLAKKSKL